MTLERGGGAHLGWSAGGCLVGSPGFSEDVKEKLRETAFVHVAESWGWDC